MPATDAYAIEIAERVASVFSVVGAGFVIFTFLLDLRFRKAINRLVFYATWGNLFANVATLISREGIKRGANAPLCQFQAFLIQWFMPADALFTFAMACNVYLTFFKQYDGASLRKLEWRYLILCYGLPFIPAIIFLFIDTDSHGKIYGAANLWCWISVKWNALRIACFYGPIWIIILFDVFIYIRVGLVVLRWRRNLISLDLKVHTPNPGANFQNRASSSSKPHPTYEVNVVSQVPHSRTRSLTSIRRPHSAAGPRNSTTSSNFPLSPSHARFASVESRLTNPNIASTGRTNTNNTTDNPSPTPTQASSTLPMVNTTIHHHRPQAPTHSRAIDANRATLSYCYTACLFFLALLVTWVPSSINRVYTLVNDNGRPSPFGLDFASGLVLPLQGFWNLIIYVVTSWDACRSLCAERVGGCCAGRRRGRGVQVDGDEGEDWKLEGVAGGGGAGRNGSREEQGRGRSGARDPYPISPAASVGPSWPRNDSRMESRRQSRHGINEGEEQGGGERADIVMSLDAHGRVIRQGRAPIMDWADAAAEGGVARGDRRSYVSMSASAKGHSRQGSGHVVEQMRGGGRVLER